MVALLTAVHVLVALILIFAVLLQSARGTDLAGAFGGMGSQAAFGPRGTATFLSKATVVLAVVFMTTSISLAILANRSMGGGGGSILSEEEAAAPTETTPPASAPATTGRLPVPVRTQGLPPGVGIEITPRRPASARPDAPATPSAPETSEPAGQAPATPATNPPVAPTPNP